MMTTLSNTGQSPVTQPAGLPDAAASFAEVVPASFADVPADVRQDVGLYIRSILGQGIWPAIISADLRLRQLFGICVKTIGRSARQPVAAGQVSAEAYKDRSLARLSCDARMPSKTQRLLDSLLPESLSCSPEQSSDVDLTSEPAAQFVTALAQQPQAQAYALNAQRSSMDPNTPNPKSATKGRTG